MCFFAKTVDYLLLEVGRGFLEAQLRGIVWLRASSASHVGTDVDASHAGIKHSLKYANVGFSDLGHTRSHIMMKIRRDASASSRSHKPLKNNRDPGYPSLFPARLSVCLTSGRELFGVDDFGGILLAGAEFDAAAHH